MFRILSFLEKTAYTVSHTRGRDSHPLSLKTPSTSDALDKYWPQDAKVQVSIHLWGYVLLADWHTYVNFVLRFLQRIPRGKIVGTISDGQLTS